MLAWVAGERREVARAACSRLTRRWDTGLGLAWLGLAWLRLEEGKGKGRGDDVAPAVLLWVGVCVCEVVVSGVVTNGSIIRQDGSKLWT